MGQNEQITLNQHYANTLIAAGSSGFIGAFSTFIFASIKKRLQSGQALPSITKMGPRAWLAETFRGSINYSFCFTPPSVIQQMSDEYGKEKDGSGNESSQLLKTLFSGAIGGIASTVIENILLQQQLQKATASQATMALINQSSTRLFRGIKLIMIREAMFGYCYLKGVKQAGNYATQHFGENYVAPAQIIVGILGALASHPVDTTATIMQRYDYTTKQAARHLMEQPNPLKSFYRGGLTRVCLFTTAVFVISRTQQAVMTRLEN